MGAAGVPGVRGIRSRRPGNRFCPQGGWNVKKDDAKRSSGHFDTQREAEDRAREIVRLVGGGEATTHGTDGRIRDSDTVPPGRDPHPPKDRK